jgi:hypothetical protein
MVYLTLGDTLGARKRANFIIYEYYNLNDYLF